MDKSNDPTIDALVRAFYGAFDNRGSRDVSGEALYGMFAKEAIITRLAAGQVETLNVVEFVEPRLRLLQDGALADFNEWEIEGETIALGDIAGHWSLYRKRGMLNGCPYAGGGRKLFQLYRQPGKWLISALLWHDD